jgi:hypothetical protein
MSTKGTADTSLVKQPNEKVEYTLEQLQEFKKCCDPVTGPLYFMTNFMWIQHPTQGRLLFTPYKYQLDLIQNYNTTRKSINMLGRQMGKCLTEKINIVIRNKANEVYDIPIGIFHEYEAAKRDGTTRPDISPYKRSE